ncbi:FAD-binding oxidoreductase [Actinoallomurus iriomotensis]|uniref:Oxidoreductase n=1 Tax=Actinoallomurus iriomotensis TaxID=478107 RepID=A0A9W6RH24_9ACTN|nr:FAD-binding oxidoreductase [Actinoallomurus iriomotensis]GLY75434.1 oxidoreductase [Actinoallomurus iriomotensis]
MGIAARDIQQVLVERGDPDYEKARASMAANECAPSRRPDVIVQAACAEEVREAVALARAHRMKVTVRAGEHGWGGAPLRDGGMLIDLSRLRGCGVENGTATVQPGVSCQDLTRALADRDRAFPVAHRGSVALSGFVLAGGIGWNSRAWGPACASVEAIEAVTATGEIVHCDDHENSGLLWAARGGGPGFFAAVTSFRLRLRHLPPAIMTTRYVFPLADVEDVAYWADEITGAIPANVELSVALTTTDGGSPLQVVVVTATAFSCAWNDAIRCLEPLRECPFAGRALIRQVDQPTPFAVLFTGSAALWPGGRRTAADSLWLNGGFSGLLPGLARYVENAPSPESIVVAEPAPGGPAVPEMAFAPLGRIRLGCYAMWTDRSADGANLAWLRELTAAAEPQATGRCVAETDLAAEPQRARRSFTAAAWERFQALRARYDPDGVFETYPQP